MIYFVRFSTGLYAGYDLEQVIFVSDIKKFEDYLDNEYYEYMSDYEYLVYDDWIEKQDGVVNSNEFYESKDYLSYIENGSTFFKKLTQEEYEQSYDCYEVVNLD